jgi:hypothetical protein
MKSWSIFAHSFGMVFRNLRQALQIGVVPVLLTFAGVFALLSLWGVSLSSFLNDEEALDLLVQTNSGFLFLGFLGVSLIIAIMMLWIVVSWHRFVLLEEYPQGWVPPFRFDRVLSYFGHGCLLGILMMVAMIPGFLILGVLVSGAPVLGGAVFFVLIVTIAVGFYRLVPILPAAAIGKPLTLKESWAATAGETGTFLGLMFIGFLFQMALNIFASLFMLIPVVGIVLVYLVLLVMSLVNVSILTTLYGHYIEERPI